MDADDTVPISIPALPPPFAQSPPPGPQGRARWRRRALRFGPPLAAMLAVFLMANGWLRCAWGACPNVDRLRSYQPGQASRLLDRKGRHFGDLRPVEGETVPLSRIPKHARDAFLAIEDQRFYDHGGVDWRRVLGAALANLRSREIHEGFSTITMQLARNVFPDRLPAKERTLRRKLMEVRVAYRIEKLFGKDEIFQLYLSHIYFGNGARGVDAAARHYFGTRAAQLTLPQAALLAALPKAPTHYDPRRHPDRARERRDLVLDLMQKQGRLAPAEAALARAAPLGISRRKYPAGAEPGLAAFFAEEVRRQLEEQLGERLYDEQLRVTTTLDVDLQKPAEEELARQLKPMRADAQGALVALQAGTGDVLAWIGGRDFRESRFDRVKGSQRQAGSAFKPFVYAAALGEGHLLSEHLRDEPFSLDLGQGRTWEPKNYDGQYDGVVTLREALIRSRNIPTILLAREVGLEKVQAAAKNIGITSDIDVTPALPLGTVAVSPLELATAYQAFATLGVVAPPRFVLAVIGAGGETLMKAEAPKAARVLDAGVAYLVTDVLQDAVSRGTGTAVRQAGYKLPVAGKTGTTNGATDAWFIGYTPELVAAVWIGYDIPRPISRSATGGRLAAPVWGRMMVRAHAGRTEAPGWTRPPEVVLRSVNPETGGVLAKGCRPWDGRAYTEVFLRSKLPRAECPDQGEAMLADAREFGIGGDERTGLYEMWPRDLPGASEAAPPREYEEADRQERRRRRDEWQREREREIEEAVREARDEEERQRKQWEKEDRRLQKEWKKQRERARKDRERRGRDRDS